VAEANTGQNKRARVSSVSLVRGDANAADPGTEEEAGLKHEYRPGAVAQSNVCCVSHRELKLFG
jgi:hypothetical protein